MQFRKSLGRMTMKFPAACFSFLAVGFICVGSVAFAQSSDDDIARVERKIAMYKLALEIYARADKRAKEAFENSPTGVKLQEAYEKEYENMVIKCLKHRQTRKPLLTRTDQEECESYVSGLPKYREYEYVVYELRDKFISEEIEDLELNESDQRDVEKLIEKF